MNTYKNLSRYVVLTMGALASAPIAQALAVKLPPETASYKPSDLAGYRLVQKNCMTCHSAQYVEYQPPSSPRAYWDATVKKMKTPFGAPFPDADIPAMVDYLVKIYGAERATSALTTADAARAAAPTVTAAKQNSDSSSASQTTRDPQALLNANGCFACHAIDKKVVGPAFKEISAKYAGKPDAASQIARSLREGSDGKWGSLPMPPFTQLSDAELSTLATWILGR